MQKQVSNGKELRRELHGESQNLKDKEIIEFLGGDI